VTLTILINLRVLKREDIEMGKPVMIFIPKDCNMIIAFETEEELLKKTDNRRMLPLYGYAEQHKKEFPNLYLAYFKGARANKTPAEMDRMDKALKKVVKIVEYMICLTAQSTSCTRCPAWEKPAIMYPATMGCRTDFTDIQNKKECGGNRQWQRRFLRNWAANTKCKATI